MPNLPLFTLLAFCTFAGLLNLLSRPFKELESSGMPWKFLPAVLQALIGVLGVTVTVFTLLELLTLSDPFIAMLMSTVCYSLVWIVVMHELAVATRTINYLGVYSRLELTFWVFVGERIPMVLECRLHFWSFVAMHAPMLSRFGPNLAVLAYTDAYVLRPDRSAGSISRESLANVHSMQPWDQHRM